MKNIKVLSLAMFSLIIFLPLVAFNFKEEAVSNIDNRMLTKNPFKENYIKTGGSFKGNLENYIDDRIGFRDEMILFYTLFHDRLFHKMVHPIYTYGKDGYIFGAGLSVDEPYTQYHVAFAEMLSKIQKYCQDREVPFLFVFNPAKPAVFSEYIADGINYDREWANRFLADLDKRGINYVDNTALLREKAKAGESTFNQKFDANHWNMLGAFYGTNAALQAIKKDIPTVHVNTLDEMNLSQTLETSLLISKFPIREYIPFVIPKDEVDSSLEEMFRQELEFDPQYDTFGYDRNEKRLAEDSPKALVFQGSYMNTYGYRYFANSFGEYIYVQDYQNMLELPYFYNIFKPDCVIFEVAEYTFEDSYFHFDKMKDLEFNPCLKNSGKPTVYGKIRDEDLRIEKGKTLTKIHWETTKKYDYVWLLMDREYDMKKSENGYEVTVMTKDFDAERDGITLDGKKGATLSSYVLEK